MAKEAKKKKKKINVLIWPLFSYPSITVETLLYIKQNHVLEAECSLD